MSRKVNAGRDKCATNSTIEAESPNLVKLSRKNRGDRLTVQRDENRSTLLSAKSGNSLESGRRFASLALFATTNYFISPLEKLRSMAHVIIIMMVEIKQKKNGV